MHLSSMCFIYYSAVFICQKAHQSVNHPKSSVFHQRLRKGNYLPDTKLEPRKKRHKRINKKKKKSYLSSGDYKKYGTAENFQRGKIQILSISTTQICSIYKQHECVTSTKLKNAWSCQLKLRKPTFPGILKKQSTLEI